MANPTGKGGRRFQPGNNATKGRPKADHDITELARSHTAMAIATLVRIAGDPTASHSAQVAAATALLDRGYGRPKQTVEADVRNVIYAVGDRPLTAEEWERQYCRPESDDLPDNTRLLS